MRETMDLARRVATTDAGVLITGESGTGKEILARAIHTYSHRAEKPLIPFNCAAVPREMLESQLFGHRRGAFTGADRDNPGVIRAARGGTLFLDEIGELAIELQPKLLRFLESGEICPLGETTPFTVDVRVIAATNARLEEAVKNGRFREDLFYRLHIVPLQIPPLRDRRDEIPALVHHFVTRASADYRKGQIRVAENTMEQLLLFPCPATFVSSTTNCDGWSRSPNRTPSSHLARSRPKSAARGPNLPQPAMPPRRTPVWKNSCRRWPASNAT